MRFDIFFDISTYLMVITGFYSLILAGIIPPLLFPILLIPVILGYLFDRRRISIPDFSWINTPLLLLVFLFTIFRIFTQTDIVDALSQLTIIIQLAKILAPKKSRDYLYIFSISFLQILVASVLTTSLTFAFIFIIYAISATWAFMGHNLNEQIYEQNSASITIPAIKLSPHFIFTTVWVVFLSFFITAILFITIPRLGSGLILPAVSRKIVHTGFSDEVNLEKASLINEDSSIVIRAKPFGKIEKLSHPLIWRGLAFESFDGMKWTQSSNEIYPLNPASGGIFFLDSNVRDPEPLKWEVYLEPLGTPLIFIPYGAYRLNMNFQRIFHDKSSNLYLPFTPGECIVYRVESSMSHSRKMDKETGINLQDCLNLPPMGKGIKELAENITVRAKSDYEKAVLIEKYLRENYSYSLKDNPTGIEEFLLTRRKGHCELFATAMAVMLRLSGIPARLVSGFTGGEWNPYGKYFMIRQKDAHTWVEAFIEPDGWIVFDPTPPSTKKEQYPAIVKAAFVYFDFIRYSWQRYIISYNIYDQIAILRKIRETNRRWNAEALSIFDYFSKKIRIYREELIIPVIITCAISALFLVLYIFKKIIPLFLKYHGETGISRDCIFYYKTLNILSKKGFIKRPSQTPWEFCYEIKQRKSDLAPFMEKLTSLYLRVRFGGKRINDEEKQLIKDILNEIRKR